MSKIHLFPALCLAFLTFVATACVRADETSPVRPQEWAQPVGNAYNFYQMSPTLYRSALPDDRVIPELEKLNIHTVINFLPEPDANWLSQAGIRQVQLPYRTNHVDDADVIATLRAIQVAQKEGAVLIHCKHGTDRTGLMSAMYRVVIQGWSKEDALAEMTLGGFGESKGFKDSVRYMMKADVDKLRTALANGDCSTSAFALCSMTSWVKTSGTGS